MCAVYIDCDIYTVDCSLIHVPFQGLLCLCDNCSLFDMFGLLELQWNELMMI